MAKGYVWFPADDEPLRPCREQLHENIAWQIREGRGDADPVRRRNEYERAIVAFYEMARRVQTDLVSAAFGRVPEEDQGESKMLIEVRGAQPGDGQSIVKCTCWPRERAGAGFLWTIKSLRRWAETDAARTEHVELLGDQVRQQIVDSRERGKFEQKLVPGSQGNEWTYFRVLSLEGIEAIIEGVERFCRWVSGNR